VGCEKGTEVKKKHSQDGAAMVEFAIVLPMLLLLIFGMIEFSLLLYNKAVITNASREAARAGIVYTPQDEDMDIDAWKAKREVDIEGIASDYCADYLITFGSSTNPLTVDLASPPCVENSGDDLVVDVTYQYGFLVFPKIISGLFGGSDTDGLTLKASTTMRCE
jgi:Flp pilus assembly protein TadG